jgi:hypothetical protein
MVARGGLDHSAENVKRTSSVFDERCLLWLVAVSLLTFTPQSAARSTSTGSSGMTIEPGRSVPTSTLRLDL